MAKTVILLPVPGLKTQDELSEVSFGFARKRLSGTDRAGKTAVTRISTICCSFGDASLGES
jgi:hypothetical protein